MGGAKDYINCIYTIGLSGKSLRIFRLNETNKMPTVILNIALLITLLLALGLSSTGYGLFAHYNAGTCLLNFSIKNDSIFGIAEDRKWCNISFASYIIATICIAAVTLMELNRLVYKAIKCLTQLYSNVSYCIPSYFSTIGKIIQIALLAISTVFLLISGTSVAVGWAKTCKNLKYNSHCLG